ncbi:MAG: hypothetical protein IT460_17785 [Planctomycetes bacterium]|nr:hypothetical protein [Planctomycetota bacterium]
MRRLAPALALAAALLGAPGGTARAGEPVLADPDFGSWADGRPTAWRLETGAVTGEGKPSRVERGEEGGVALAGEASTGTWRMLAQTVAVPPGTTVRLRFEARARGLRLDPGQRQNAYVGLVERTGERLDVASLRVEAGFSETWAPCDVVARVRGDRVDVVAFLSTTGRLEARRLRLDVVPPEASFDLLVDHVDRYYSFLSLRGVAWRTHAASFRAAALAARTPEAFAAVAGRMLAALKDPHVWVRGPDGKTTVPGAGPVDPGFDARATAQRLVGVRAAGKAGFVGSAAPRVGYAAIGALPSDPEASKALLDAVASVLPTDGALVLDLRPCGGGDERVALALAGRLTDRPRVYARRRVRSGPGPDDFSPWKDAVLWPTGGTPFPGPVVVILGPACMSSGEGLAQMLAVLPQVTTVGRPTRGASGNPMPLDLPVGVTVSFSRWQDALPDGTLLEGHGVVPTVPVEGGEGDPPLRRAVELALDALNRRPAPGR